MVAWLEKLKKALGQLSGLSGVTARTRAENDAMLDRVIAALSPSGAQPVARGERDVDIGKRLYRIAERLEAAANQFGGHRFLVDQCKQEALYLRQTAKLPYLYASPSPLAAEGEAEREKSDIPKLIGWAESMLQCGMCLRCETPCNKHQPVAAPSGQREEDGDTTHNPSEDSH